VACANDAQFATAATAEPTAQPKQSEIDSANRLFEAGKLPKRGKLYSQIVAQNPKDYSERSNWVASIAFPTGSTMRRSGWKKAISLRPDDTDPRVMLARYFYRRDDFSESGRFAERRGREQQ